MAKVALQWEFCTRCGKKLKNKKHYHCKICALKQELYETGTK